MQHGTNRTIDGTCGPFRLAEATIASAQIAMERGEVTAHELTRLYLERIDSLDKDGPRLHSVIEVNPDALDVAAALDAERHRQGPRGRLHGIPILLKDNVDTADTMLTTAGSLALVGSRPAEDAFVVTRLRESGAVLLGKTNLSEWANFRSTHSISGWSARGGQTRNPYALDRNPCGSSSGSAVAVSANLAMAAIGTETDGSIVCPAHANGLVGLKPTVGLASRTGIIPIAHSQDTAGPMTRTVRDAALLLGALAGIDPADPATLASAGRTYADYISYLDPEGLRGARIGVARSVFFGYSPEADAIAESAIAMMQTLGAIIVDPADIPSAIQIQDDRAEHEVLLYEFKADLNAYLRTRRPDKRYGDLPVLRTLKEIIAFNEAHAAEEMPFFGQERFLEAEEKGPLTDPLYVEALATSHRLSRQQGIDAVMDRYDLDALVAPTGQPAWQIDPLRGDDHSGGSSSPAAMAGYPLISVPAGFAFGLPVGITFMGRAFGEPTLLKLAYAFEQATLVRKAPMLAGHDRAP